MCFCAVSSERILADFSLFQAFCGSSAQISKDNMPSESYENVLIVQGNDFMIKARKIL